MFGWHARTKIVSAIQSTRQYVAHTSRLRLDYEEKSIFVGLYYSINGFYLKDHPLVTRWSLLFSGLDRPYFLQSW